MTLNSIVDFALPLDPRMPLEDRVLHKGALVAKVLGTTSSRTMKRLNFQDEIPRP